MINRIRNFNRLKAGIIYWVIVFSIAGFLSYKDRTEYKNICNIVQGQITEMVPTSSVKGTRPLAQYVVGSDTNYFAVRGSLTLSVGDAIQVIYEREHPRIAERYHKFYWFNFPLIINIILIAVVPFGLIWGLTALFKTKTIILPSNKPLG
jgi:hypothetical protein